MAGADPAPALSREEETNRSVEEYHLQRVLRESHHHPPHLHGPRQSLPHRRHARHDGRLCPPDLPRQRSTTLETLKPTATQNLHPQVLSHPLSETNPAIKETAKDSSSLRRNLPPLDVQNLPLFLQRRSGLLQPRSRLRHQHLFQPPGNLKEILPVRCAMSHVRHRTRRPHHSFLPKFTHPRRCARSDRILPGAKHPRRHSLQERDG
jgi:hypothetical protein